jgi:hypothetical protein
MVKKILIGFAVISLLVSSCGNETAQKKPVDANQAYYESIKHMTGLAFQPRIQKADSVEIMFYDNPDGDPKRYTRYYKWFPSSDSNIVNDMKQSVDKHFERIERVKDCRSEGKMYFFAEGNPMQTVYFSNRGDSCNHLYFIADGWFFYMPMDSSTAGKLKELKARSLIPPGEM